MHGTAVGTRIYPQISQILAAIDAYFGETLTSQRAVEVLAEVLATYPPETVEFILTNTNHPAGSLLQIVDAKRAQRLVQPNTSAVPKTIRSMAETTSVSVKPTVNLQQLLAQLEQLPPVVMPQIQPSPPAGEPTQTPAPIPVRTLQATPATSAVSQDKKYALTLAALNLKEYLAANPGLITAETALLPPPITIPDVFDVVCRHYGISKQDLLSKGRSPKVAHPRQVAHYLASTCCNLSLIDVGTRIGGRDHSTVLNSITKIKHKMSQDIGFAETIADLTSKLQPSALVSFGNFLAALETLATTTTLPTAASMANHPQRNECADALHAALANAMKSDDTAYLLRAIDALRRQAVACKVQEPSPACSPSIEPAPAQPKLPTQPETKEPVVLPPLPPLATDDILQAVVTLADDPRITRDTLMGKSRNTLLADRRSFAMSSLLLLSPQRTFEDITAVFPGFSLRKTMMQVNYLLNCTSLRKHNTPQRPHHIVPYFRLVDNLRAAGHPLPVAWYTTALQSCPERFRMDKLNLKNMERNMADIDRQLNRT